MKAKSEIKSLTGVRGIASLGVMTFHYWSSGWISTDIISGAICERGYIFVDLFFILSGFVMAKAYGRQFMGRRFARVYPLYVVLFLAALAISIPRTGSYSAKYFALIMANLFLVQTWFGKYSFLGTSWSLSTELAAYLVFPALVAVVLKSRRAFAIGACIAASAAIAFLVAGQMSGGVPARTSLDTGDEGMASMVRCFCGFTIGMIVFRASRSSKAKPIGSDFFGYALIFLIAFLWILPSTPDIFIYATFPLLVLCLSLNDGFFSYLFANKTVFLLGEWSYAMYLIHILIHGERAVVFGVFSGFAPPVLADTLGSLVFFSTTILLSAFAYTWIEVPARNRIRDWMSARRTPMEAEPSVP